MNYSLAANTLRFLSADMVEKAGSGHPGAAMGMSDFFTILFLDFLNFDPENPKWENRDRLILSNGHASTILYSALFLSGYNDISMEDLKAYRSFDAAAAGHPEYGHFGGIEATTGPLGQGLGMGVGMAMAERLLHRDYPLVDHYTYVVAGDGCLMEGISYEAAAFAGRQKLSRLIVLFDDNGITIEGSTNLVTLEDRGKIFETMGWSVHYADGHDHESISRAISEARNSGKPAFVSLKTKIGFGAPRKENSPAAHGAPLGADEMAAARENLGWNFPPFEIPEEGLGIWRSACERNKKAISQWKDGYSALTEGEKREFTRRKSGTLPKAAVESLEGLIRKFQEKPESMPIRKVSPLVFENLLPVLPEFVGGAGDLGESNGSYIKSMEDIFPEKGYEGNYIHYGIREQFMGAALNGFALYGFFKACGSTYFVFSDYMRPAIRLAAMMGVPSLFLFSHDSIGVGPDGPTHQAVEQLASLRNIPRLKVYRPADAVEAVECWKLVLEERECPSVLVMARQASSPVRTFRQEGNLCQRGGYLVKKSEREQVLLISSGSDVASCLESGAVLEKKGIGVSVVSVPCLEILLEQEESYWKTLLGHDRDVVKIAVESGIDSGWAKRLGKNSHFIGMEDFGTTGPVSTLFKHFGLDAGGIAQKVLSILDAETL